MLRCFAVLCAAAFMLAAAPPPSSYAWGPTAAESDHLNVRFASPPPKFKRVELEDGSFGNFLRHLPLQPAGAPVVDFRGTPLHNAGQHPNIVAVADLDVGKADLQHCADVIYRLDAEWRYGKGDHDFTYKAVSGQALSYKSYVAGERAVIEGKGIALKKVAAPAKDTHALMRGYMDEVFSWAGTASLDRDAKKVSFGDVQPGDFFVVTGSPFGHAVLVLDVAKDDQGRVALLLGQSYMPAQSFQILKPDGSNNGVSSDWFVVEPNDVAVDTPFWAPFPKTSLHRF